MRKFNTFLVLIAVVFSTAGYIILLKVNLYIIHKEVKYELMAKNHHEESIILIIPIAKQNPINSFIEIHSKEFRYRGEMYDVISRYDSADVTIFHCIHDEDESNLFNVFAEIIKINKSDGGSSRIKHFPNIFNFYFLELFNKIQNIPPYEVFGFIKSVYNPIQEYYSPSPPPPKFS